MVLVWQIISVYLDDTFVSMYVIHLEKQKILYMLKILRLYWHQLKSTLLFVTFFAPMKIRPIVKRHGQHLYRSFLMRSTHYFFNLCKAMIKLKQLRSRLLLRLSKFDGFVVVNLIIFFLFLSLGFWSRKDWRSWSAG